MINTTIVDKYNHRYHNKIKMNSVDVKSSTCIDFDKKDNKEDPKFNVDDHLRISKYKIIFAKVYVPNWPEEVCVIVYCLINTVLKTHFHEHMLLAIFINCKKSVGTFYEKN